MYQRKSDGLYCEKIKGKVITAKTKKALKEKVSAYTIQSNKGYTVREALELWEKSKEDVVSYKTLEGYRSPMQKINAAFGDCYASEVTPAQIQALINGIAAEGYKVSTVKRPLHVLSMLYDWLITQPNTVVTSNPCVSVKAPQKLTQSHRELADAKDVDRIRNGVDLKFGLFAYLLLYTGLRKGEALALTYTDFDFSGSKILVNKSVSWQTNKPVIKEPKTESGNREVVLLTQLRDKLPKKWKGYLFSADGGKTPLTQIQFRHRWDTYCKVAGLCDVTYETHTNPNNKHTYKKAIYKSRVVPHQLRHEFATICLDAGLDEIDTQEIMGHASINTTHAIYQHIKESRREKTTDKLQNYLNGTVEVQ